MKLEFAGGFSKNTRILNLMKIRPEGADLFHEDGYTDRRKKGYAEASRSLFAILRTRLKRNNVSEIPIYYLRITCSSWDEILIFVSV